MRTDDPIVLQQIEQLERTAEALRRICGFPPLVETTATTASREPIWCPDCNFGFHSLDDLQHHVAQEHTLI